MQIHILWAELLFKYVCHNVKMCGKLLRRRLPINEMHEDFPQIILNFKNHENGK